MIEINNLTDFKIDKKFFRNIAQKILLEENKKNKTFSVAFLSKDDIKKLNKKFRNKNKPTDILSFKIEEGDYLGEIIICPEIVKENAKTNKESFKNEMKNIFIHGVLHLLDYEHEKSRKEAKIMEEKQQYYFKKIKN
ncbi:MAG TPA: rRNA maturation RNase YbeY [Candidatus Pacearchaeota archaeon]|mgnify:FL=1|nr:rRNA maturation RNase YbeY [Candidatus Paceibacterota bacterium]HOK00538.1 rRNA maturation RNase YbeY [Candidatus Pacearchaeota archaeon]HOL90335.1 rRNA maturation RNase YbeY [Candidatus Pacearchaeota archaeon]HPO68563.1 rRNA maturation RNase YbeY [Candidatus Pacearchaeota archaeon]